MTIENSGEVIDNRRGGNVGGRLYVEDIASTLADLNLLARLDGAMASPVAAESEPVGVTESTKFGQQIIAALRIDSDADDGNWQDRANCLGVDNPDLFFPERGESTREAKEVCRGCCVRGDCLEYALVNGEKFGIWGGLSERERRRLRRQRAQAARSTT